MALQHHPITTSAVILSNTSHTPPNPPLSPPSPATPCDTEMSPELDDLSSIGSDEDSISTFNNRVSSAVHVLGTQATALSFLTRLYETDPIARGGFNAAVEAITRKTNHPGKLVVSGVGKSGYICQKFVATLKSLHIRAVYMHPTEALHGDLGLIDPENDTILLITYSGSIPELLLMLQYLPELPIVVMTRHTRPTTCEILKIRPQSILLPAPIHMTEMASFGVNAPTTSTTSCLALCDALSMVLANHYHADVAATFSRFHPGGAIGAASRTPTPKIATFSSLTIPLSSITELPNNTFTGANILISAYRSPTRWLKQNDFLIPPSRIEKIQLEYLDEPARCIQGLMVEQKDWISIPGEISILDAKSIIEEVREREGLDKRYSDHGIVAAMDDEDVIGVLEIGVLMASPG